MKIFIFALYYKTNGKGPRTYLETVIQEKNTNGEEIKAGT